MRVMCLEVVDVALVAMVKDGRDVDAVLRVLEEQGAFKVRFLMRIQF